MCEFECVFMCVQRAVDNVYTKVAVALWQLTQLPGLGGIHLAPSPQVFPLTYADVC